jgi:hypothetical protein
MYKTLTFLATLFFMTSVDGQVSSTRDIIGRWEHKDFKLEFFTDGRLGLTMQGGTLPAASYTADFHQNPAVIHLIVPSEKSKLTYKAYLKFKSNIEMELQWFKENDFNYSRNGQTIRLKKVPK